MSDVFELDWLGGPAERRFRKAYPDTEHLPWGSLAAEAHPPELRAHARRSWTLRARNEYATAVSFTRLLEAMLLARAPIDLVGMAGGFVADEMHHVELCARVAMELGGAPPVPTDFAGLGAVATADAPLGRATELMVRLCCVGEAFSVSMLAGTMAASTHPLPRAVLASILRDEAHHGRLGWLFLDWVAPRLDDASRAHLATVAIASLQAFAPLWRRALAGGDRDVAVRALGWMPAAEYVATARASVQDDVLAPLARHGIVPPPDEVDALWA